MKATTLKAMLAAIITEYGDLDVCIECADHRFHHVHFISTENIEFDFGATEKECVILANEDLRKAND